MTGTRADLAWGGKNSNPSLVASTFGGCDEWPLGRGGGIKGSGGARVGVYLHLIPAGVGRAGDCIYVNTPLTQSRTKQQTPGLLHCGWQRRLPRDWGGNPIPQGRTTLKDSPLDDLKRQGLDTPAICNLRIYQRSLGWQRARPQELGVRNVNTTSTDAIRGCRSQEKRGDNWRSKSTSQV